MGTANVVFGNIREEGVFSPGIGETLATTTSSAATTAAQTSGAAVRISLSEAGHVAFGENPTATTTDPLLQANTPEIFYCPRGAKVAVIDAA